MMCNFPVRLPDRDFLVPCRHCLACKIARRREWSARLIHESQYWENISFITLTYSDETIPVNGSLDKDALTNFFKRLRRRLSGRKLKYFACGEYGETTFRPHYHAILFGVDVSERDAINDAWSLGHVHVGTLTPDSVQYVAGYIDKKYGEEKNAEVYGSLVPPYQRQSNGLGLRFARDNAAAIKQSGHVMFDGKKIGLPRYYVEKLGICKETLREKAKELSDEAADKIMEKLEKVPQLDSEYLEVYSQEFKRGLIDYETYKKEVVRFYGYHVIYPKRDKELQDKKLNTKPKKL